MLGLVQYLVEHLAGRPDEGFAGDILLVAGLLADEDDPRILGSLAEHGLGRVAPQRAAAAGFGDLAQFGDGTGGACMFRSIVRLTLAPMPGLDPGVMRRRRRRHPGNHVRRGLLRSCDHSGNERRLGKVPPIFLRHLGLHRLHLEPRRIEDVLEIGQPQRLRTVLGRKRRDVDAGGPKASSSPSQCADPFGVRIDQRMPVKRRTKNPALRSTMK